MIHMEVVRQILKDSDLTLAQIRVLLAILSFNTELSKMIKREYLSKLLNITPQNISRTTRILELKGYISKKTNESGIEYSWVSPVTPYGITRDTPLPKKKRGVSPVIPPDTISNISIYDNSIQKGGSGGETSPIPYSEIIADLNQVTGKMFLASGQKNRELINARWNEGFRFKHFHHVHRVKTEEWKSKVEMNKYLRPETLYSNKFHSYVNESFKKDIQKIAEEEKMNAPETQEAIDYLKVLTGNHKQLN